LYRKNCCLGTAVPPGLANLVNLEILNLFNNHITELPISLSQMPKLRILNVGSVSTFYRTCFYSTIILEYLTSGRMNRLDVLPRGFGAFPVLEVLDLTYNNLSEKNLPGNFFMMGQSRLLDHLIRLFAKLAY